MCLTATGAGAYASPMRTMLALAVATVLIVGRTGLAQVPSCTYGPGALPADTLPPGTLHGDAIPIEHIVVIMQENRSYDHYFGRLRREERAAARHYEPQPDGRRSDQALPHAPVLRGRRPRPFVERHPPRV